jgi:Ca2+:H+ antiporter
LVFTYLLALVPVPLLLAYLFHAPPVAVFLTAVLAIIPLAEWIRRATEQIAIIAGPAIGGLLNVTFGNMAEFILALFILARGEAGVVKAQITGSIIGNSLLGLGLAIVIGSWGRAHQKFSRERAGLASSLLLLSVIALLVPALFDYTERGIFSSPNVLDLDNRLSLGVSIVLILVYLANLSYSLFTHRDVFALEEESETASWSLWRAVAVLIGATILISFESELISGALESTATQLGLSPFFLGVTILAVVGNAAEYVSAVYFARQDKMGLVMSITVGSSIQVALLIAPLLVIVSQVFRHPMDLVFTNPLELIAVGGCAFAVNAIAQDGETNWFEGLLLLAVYVLLAMAFLYATPHEKPHALAAI